MNNKSQEIESTTAVGVPNTSSLSEYLIETIPGWRVEDLLDSPPPPPPSSFGFSEVFGDMLPIWDADQMESNHLSCPFSSPPLPPPPIFPAHRYPSSNISFGGQISFKESREVVPNNLYSSRKQIKDDGCFVVPQITPPSNPSSKRSRTFW